MRTHRIIFGILLFALAGFLPAEGRAQGSAPGSIVLSRVEGTVSVQEKATTTVTPATNGLSISEGFVVRTGTESRVILVFSNGSTINLGADSELDIETFLQDPFESELRLADMTDEPSTSTTRINLTRGEVVGNVKKLNTAGGSSFTVQTPAGAAGIRGTTFRIVFRPTGDGRANFSLTMLEGDISFAAKGVVSAPVNVLGDESIAVEVTVNEATGDVTVQLPTGQVVKTTVPAAEKATLTATVQEVFNQVAEIIVQSKPATPAPTTTTTTSNEGTGDTKEGDGTTTTTPTTTTEGTSNSNSDSSTNKAPPAPVKATDTTPGAGKV